MNNKRQNLAIASILSASSMLESFDSPRRRPARSGDEHIRTTAEGSKKRNRKRKNKQAKKSRKQNR